MNDDELIERVNSEYDLENLILNIIHEWEAKNNPDLVLDLSLDYNKTIIEMRNKYRGLLRLTKPYIKVPYIPNNVTNLWCGEHMLIPNLPTSLKKLFVSKSTVYPGLPDSIKTFCGDFGNNVPRLPQNLLYLDCSSSDISEIPRLPPKLETFICRFSNIERLRAGDLPSTLKRLDLTYNQITHIECLPPALEVLKHEHNDLTQLPELPTTLQCLILYLYEIGFPAFRPFHSRYCL
jgi:Leucine-rich repeat (LRR) protein